MDQQSAMLSELESMLLGGERRYTRVQVAHRAGVPIERAERLWRALGFPGVPDDQVVFSEDDVDALRMMASLVDAGVVQADAEASLARSLGQSMARLAEWQTRVVRDVVQPVSAAGSDSAAVEGALPPDTVPVAAALVPAMEKLQSYVWRRHLLAAAGRVLAVPAADAGQPRVVIGFADIVSFTTLSRAVDDAQLARFIDHFEGTAAEIVAERHGRVVKTIGDEVLFVADAPAAGARIGLELAERIGTDQDFPSLRVGLAYGGVLSRLGDVYGPVVNVAARLTSLARPGTVLVDRELMHALSGHPRFVFRRLRRTAVRGYARLEPWVLRAGTQPDGSSET